MKAIPDSPVGVSCGLHCPPAPLWIIKGKPRVSQLRGKLSSAPKWNTDSYPPIYPFPSTRCSCGSAFTDLWLVFESSRRKQLFLWNTRFNTVFCPGMGVLLCGGCWESTAPRDGTSTLQQLPKLRQGGISSWWSWQLPGDLRCGAEEELTAPSSPGHPWKKQKKDWNKLPSAISLKNPMSSRVTPWEQDPTGGFISQAISRQLVVFL